MLDSLINYLDKFGPEILVILFGFLVILFTIFLWLWFSNRRKYHNLKHAIPANIVKSYLDSIIQNSTALKSQLFRGGGLEVSGVPSVMSLQSLVGGDSLAVSGTPSSALLEELNQKKALIAALEAQLAVSKGSQPEIENKLTASLTNLGLAEKKIKELESLLNQMRSGDSNLDSTLKAELQMISEERNDLRDRLKEFEIIADDLANLKRLQQENEQLKRSLAAQDSSSSITGPFDGDEMIFPPSEKEGEDGSQTETQEANESPALDESSLQALKSESDEIPSAASSQNQPKPDSDENPKPEKAPEDLLSEFEKMLG